MKIKFRNRVFFLRTKRLILLVILLAVFCLGLFVFEYKGFGNIIKERYPQFGFLASLPKLLDIFYLSYQLSSTSLPVYNLIVDPADLSKLEKSLAKNDSDVLEAKHQEIIPAEFIFNKQSYQVKMRVHGDLPNHWRYEKKSWQIIFNDANLFEGKKKINLIIPEDRSFISEQLSNYRAKKLGLVVPESRFAVLEINGRQPAVYFEIEAWSKEFLEKSQWPDQINFYGENDTLAFQGFNHDLLENPGYWDKYVRDGQSKFDNYADIDLLGRLVHQSSDEEFYREIPALIDMDNFYKWQAHSVLMGSTHQNFIHNVRLVFNNSRGKFEFIPWDLRQYDWDEFADLNYNSLVSRILKNPEFLHQRNKVLWNYLKDDKNLEDDLKFYDQTYQEVKTAFYKDRIKGFSNFYFNRKIVNNRNLLIQQYRHIQKTLADNQIFAVVRILPQSVQLDITIKSFSDIIYNGSRMFTQREIPKDFAFEEEFKLLPTAYTFSLNKSDFNPDDFKLNLVNAVTGLPVEPVVRYVDEETFKDFDKINYSREEFLRDNPIFKKGTTDERIILPAGIYQINKTIVVPKSLSLEIKPGSQLIFAPDTSLFSYSPVQAPGTNQAPIIFTAQDKNKGWGVMAILDTGKSIFKHCVFEYGGQDYVNGTFVSGQLAFHYTEAEVKNCRFKFANGDDSLNVKKAKADIENNYFYKNGFDGIDFDWAGGRIVNNYFSENGNDAIDLGGVNEVMIWNNRIDKSGDKCISIGEKSQGVIVANNLLKSCEQGGLAVKDNSKVSIINNTIINNKIGGIRIYEKKPIFGGAFPEAINNIIWGNEKSIEIDSKSSINISFSDIEGGYQGENNLNQEPIFQNKETGNYLLLDKEENLSLIKGGNLEAINAILKEKLETVPIGLISLPPIFND